MNNKFLNEIISLRRKQAEKSLFAFAKCYMPHYLKLNPSKAHHEVYDLLTNIMAHRGNRMAVAAPRGFGKSTLITLFYIVYAICYCRERFIVILSDTASQAEQILENIKKELTESEKIRTDFPEVFEKEGRPKPPRWRRDQIETLNGVKVIALGSGQKIRGRKFGKDRPTLVVADDIETSDNVSSEQSRSKIKEWFTKSVIMAGDEETNFIFLGTLYHPLCLLKEYLNPELNLEWIKKTYKAILSHPKHLNLWLEWSEIYNGRKGFKGKRGTKAAKAYYSAQKEVMNEGVELLWPEKWSYYDLMVLREENFISFCCELQNEPLDPKMQIFKIEKFHYFDKTYGSIENLLNPHSGRQFEFHGSCDPCTGHDMTRGDYAAIIIVARNCQDGTLYVVEADICRRSPQETIERIIEYCRIYRPRSFFVETNNFQKLMKDDLEKELCREGIYTPVLGVINTGNKEKRIHSLEPWVNKGVIQFMTSQKILLDQFMYFPNGEHDDALDALEIVVSNIADTPSGPGGTLCIKLNSGQSDVLRDIPDLREQCGPRIYDSRKQKDRFVPEGW